MELIQNWNIEDKIKLKNFILDKIDGKYKDITIVGSRIFGGFTPTSDIDVVVWKEDWDTLCVENFIFDEVENSENPNNNFKICIKIRNHNHYVENNWSNYNYNLPKYSIIDNVYYNGNINHIQHRKNLKVFIRNYISNGGDRRKIPFDEFDSLNNYLL